MDARKEAQKRYDDWAEYGGSAVQDAFEAGAAWALREYADGISVARAVAGTPSVEWIQASLRLTALEIEEGE